MNTTVPGVSVVIPHYGDPAPTQELVTALTQQVGAPELEIIVVDDASPEPYVQVGDETTIRRPANGGFGSTVNVGAAAAQREYLLILNSDLTVGPNLIADLTRLANPLMPAVVSPEVIGHSGSSQWTGRHFPRVTHTFVNAFSGLARFRHTRWWHESVGHNTSTVMPGVHRTDWVVGAVLYLPTQSFHDVGGFDERFYMNSEEIDLQRRLGQRGVHSYVLGDLTVEHEGGGSSNPELRRTWVVTSALRFAEKWNDHPGLHRAALGAAAILNFVVNAVRQLAGRDVRSLETLRREFRYARVPISPR
ncbi:N-acetylglucosaminyl-diphospho-decaprenol L-rhamnosyltransferase [Pseudoclavibacter sp. JAI123]|uniref:glycosyltransferase family 2 protein n=1 Tax=Pseudoclavibacter sp. JAI123 TaxID=2723065 RepID=UPI0015CE5810|nr:glycosyltransferase family 2 protein [Pseudoclavibacter sp. JAI123]NYF12755.1 N-acetylglucosaminyl-diphospho-decaprenol L-rhamnosyltransferase [Pseudoclavibacter sp. JAI123]